MTHKTGILDTNAISTLRNQIDNIDEQIQTLINQRAKIAQEVANVKKNHENDPIFYRPEREAQVLKAVMARNSGPLSGEKMARLFREIMSVCLELEAKSSFFRTHWHLYSCSCFKTFW